MRALLTRPIFWLGAVLVIGLAGTYAALSWPSPAAAETAPVPPPAVVRDVSVQELHAAASQGALVIDVREPHEFAAGRVPESVLVPLATVPARAGDFSRDEPLYVICRTDNRSAVAAEALVAAGFSDVRNVRGGMVAWAAAGLPIER